MSSLTITGKVVGMDGISLPGVLITVVGESIKTPHKTTTDEDGHFELEDLPPPGQYLLSASMIGFMDWKKPVVVSPGQAFIANITMYEE